MKDVKNIVHKSAPVTQLAYFFAIRRLVRTGSVSRADITTVIACSTVIASKAMQQVAEFSSDVIKKGQKLQFKDPYFVSRPNNKHIFMEIASDKQLNQAIKNGGEPCHTGLYSHELPVKIKTWSSGDSISNGLLTAIAACTLHINQYGRKIDHRASMSILYVSMQKGATNKWRNIVPLGLERILDQWRLIAQDLDSKDYPIKTYVLARISEHRLLTNPLPPNFYQYLKVLNDLNELVNIELNPELTLDQERAFKNELHIHENGTLEVPQRSKIDFLRRFSDMPTSESTLWPIIIKTTAIQKR